MRALKALILLLAFAGAARAASPAQVIDKAVRSSTMSVPLDGVAWTGAGFRIDFSTAATVAQRRTAIAIAYATDISQAALDAFDVQQKRDLAAATANRDALLKAFVIWVSSRTGISAAQGRAELKAVVDAN